MNFVKNTNDLIVGISSLVISLWMMFDPRLTKGFTLSNTMPYLARPDVYVQLLAGCWAILAVLIVVKALDFSGKSTERKHFAFRLPMVAILPMLVFVVYTAVLEDLGFYVASFVLMTVMCFIYRLKENNVSLRDRRGVIKSLAIAGAFSLATVVVLGEVFARLLKVTLP